MIDRAHKGTRIKPSDHQPSFTPWVGTEQAATIDEDGDGKVWLTSPDRKGATVTEYACVGVCYKDGHGKEGDVWRLPLADWDALVAQVERLRREAGS